MELFEFGKYGISKKICAAEKQLELSEMVSQKKNLPYRETYKYSRKPILKEFIWKFTKLETYWKVMDIW